MKILLILIVSISFGLKVILHIHLDLRHRRFKGASPAGMYPITYLLFYTDLVKKTFEKEKSICNLLYIVSLISSLLCLIFSEIAF